MRKRTPRVEEARYRTLLHAMDEAYCTAEVLFDESGRAVDHRIIDANPVFERHTGVSNPIDDWQACSCPAASCGGMNCMVAWPSPESLNDS